jgi:hypothetical protein
MGSPDGQAKTPGQAPATAGMTAMARRKRAAAKIMMNCIIAFA